MAEPDPTSNFWGAAAAGALSGITGDTTHVLKATLGDYGDTWDWATGPISGLIGRLVKWLNELDEGAEDVLLNSLENLLQKMEVPQSLITEFKAIIRDTSTDAFPWRIITSLPAFLKTSFASTGHVSEAVATLGGRAFAAKARQTFGDINDVMLYRQLVNDPTAFQTELNSMGWSDNWQNLAYINNQQRLDPLSAAAYFQRENMNEVEYDKYLKMLGFLDPGDRAGMVELMYQLPDLGTLQELRRRNPGNDEWYRFQIKQHGFDEENLAGFDELMHRLPDPTVLIANWRRNMITEDDLTEGLGKHGYRAEDVEKIKTSSYRPLDPYELREMLRRDIIIPEEFHAGMLANGYHPDNIPNMEKLRWEVPTPTDLVRFGVREVFQPDIYERFGQDQQFPEAIVEWGKKNGLDRDVLMMYWIAHWQLPSPTQMYTMYHRGIIDRTDLIRGMKAADYMPWFQDKMIQISYQQIPRRAINTALREEIITANGAYEAYTRLGYDPVSAGIMSQLAVSEATIDLKVLTKNEILRAYRNDDYTKEQARTALLDFNYSTDAVNFFLAEQERKKELDTEAAQGIADLDVANEARDLTRSQLLKGYRDGLIELEVLTESLASLGYSPLAIDYMIQQQDTAQLLDDMEFKAEQIHKVFVAGLYDRMEAQSKLIGYGLRQPQAQRYLDRWAAEKESKEVLESQRLKTPTRSTLKSWLLQSIISPEIWLTYMRDLNYPDDTIVLYLQEALMESSE